MKKQPNNGLIDKLNAKSNQSVRFVSSYLYKKFNIFKKNKYIKKITSGNYSKLMRLDKPTGALLCLIPALWALIATQANVLMIALYTVIFTVGAFLARGAGCIINDIWDKEFDKKVERTKRRPIASGKVSVKNALLFLLALCVPTIFIILSLTKMAQIIAFITAILIVFYPLMKRITHLPQIYLGFVFNAGIFIAWFTFHDSLGYAPLVLYAVAVLWTVAYDTIYALQDVKDDAKIGVKSSALLWQENSVKYATMLYKISCVLLAILGLQIHMNFIFFILIYVSWQYAISQLELIDINDKETLNSVFESNVIFGFIVYLAFIIGSF